jgi:hypothetical protein
MYEHELNQSPLNKPVPPRTPTPKMIWLLVALSPCSAIMLLLVLRTGIGLQNLVNLGLNPVVACIACYYLLHKPDQRKVIPIIGGIFLGMVIAVFNMCLGAFVGCAFGGGNR